MTDDRSIVNIEDRRGFRYISLGHNTNYRVQPIQGCPIFIYEGLETFA